LFFSFFFNSIGVYLRFSLRYSNPTNRYPKSDANQYSNPNHSNKRSIDSNRTSTPTKLENTQTPSAYLLPTNIQKTPTKLKNQAKD